MDSVPEPRVNRFDWPEYIVFSLMLIMSVGIGLFHGCYGNKKTTKDFLLAGKTMGTFPMALSLIATFISAITLLGTPAEVYQYGTQYWAIILAFTLVTLATSYLYLPVFYDLEITSVYQYLEMRFSYSMRLLGTCTCMASTTIYMAIAVYAPSLALNQVTGINVNLSVTAIFTICIFYTAIGGMKAVIWTDVLQASVMYSAIAAITIKGTMDMGGPRAVWDVAQNGSRIELFNLNLDPRHRHTIWGLSIGSYVSWLTVYGVGQSQVQRYLTVSTKRAARRALFINGIGLFLLFIILCYCGLLIFAKYKDCDPLLSKMIKSPDQLLPLFVMDTLGGIPGLPGLFVAGILSGVLSSVSSCLNSLAANALEDLVKKRWKNMSSAKETNISIFLAVLFGIIAYGLAFLAQYLGGVQQANFAINGIIQGPILGVFTLGIFFPWANAKGALVGTFTAMALLAWLGIGATVSKLNGWIYSPTLDFSVADCTTNITLAAQPIGSASGGILEFYKISYVWYALIGQFTVVTVGLIVSFLTEPQDPKLLNPKLISSPVNKLLNVLFSQKFLQKVGWEIGALYSESGDAFYNPKFFSNPTVQVTNSQA